VQVAPVGDAHGLVFDRFGALAGNVDGSVAWAGALGDRRGEQLLVYRPDGGIRLVGDADVG